MSNDIPRRNDITRNTETELAIRHAMRCIEMDAASPHLTQAVALLEKARHAVADFVDGVPVAESPAASASTQLTPHTRLEHALAAALADMVGVLEDTEFDTALEDSPGYAEVARNRVDAARRLLGGKLDDHATEASDWAFNDYLAVQALAERAQPPAQEISLESQLHNKLHAWLKRTAPRMRSEDLDYATIKLTVLQPQGEEDGTLYLEFRVEEESHFESDGSGGRVPGVRL